MAGVPYTTGCPSSRDVMFLHVTSYGCLTTRIFPLYFVTYRHRKASEYYHASLWLQQRHSDSMNPNQRTWVSRSTGAQDGMVTPTNGVVSGTHPTAICIACGYLPKLRRCTVRPHETSFLTSRKVQTKPSSLEILLLSSTWACIRVHS